MQQFQFELAIAHTRDGRSVKIREYGRNGLTFVEGRRGQPYSIQFRNNSAFRVMAIISVDGIDVVDGKPATAESRGYIVEGYSAAEIKGWRTSSTEIRQFFFEDKERSYSPAVTGETANCGVISLKVFAEKPKPIPTFVPPQVIREEHHYHYPNPIAREWTGGSPSYTCCMGSLGSEGVAGTPGESTSVREGLICATSNTAPKFNLGTGWGAAMTDHVSHVLFEKAHEIASMDIYYTDADALERMGIVLDKEVAVTPLPQGFGGFCQPPKGIR